MELAEAQQLLEDVRNLQKDVDRLEDAIRQCDDQVLEAKTGQAGQVSETWAWRNTARSSRAAKNRLAEDEAGGQGHASCSTVRRQRPTRSSPESLSKPTRVLGVCRRRQRLMAWSASAPSSGRTSRTSSKARSRTPVPRRWTGRVRRTVKAALYDTDPTPDNDVTSANTAYNAGPWTAAGNEVTDGTNWDTAGEPVTGRATSNTADTIMMDATDTPQSGASCTLAGVFGCSRLLRLHHDPGRRPRVLFQLLRWLPVGHGGELHDRVAHQRRAALHRHRGLKGQP